MAIELNLHRHFPRSCQKRGEHNCRLNYPKFPSLRTLIAIPSKVKYPKNITLRNEKVKEAKDINAKVKAVLENNEVMAHLTQIHQASIDEFIRFEGVLLKAQAILDERQYKMLNPDCPSIKDVRLAN